MHLFSEFPYNVSTMLITAKMLVYVCSPYSVPQKGEKESYQLDVNEVMCFILKKVSKCVHVHFMWIYFKYFRSVSNHIYYCITFSSNYFQKAKKMILCLEYSVGIALTKLKNPDPELS